jgi:rubrerythrin
MNPNKENTMNRYGKVGMVSALALTLMGGATLAIEAPIAKSTLENLQTAYTGESNAKARYEAFAAKAKEEGYLSVAALFTAAAKSESIHMSKAGAAIEKLGGKPQAAIIAPLVKTTQENLESSLKGESEEAESMYPAFIKQAETDKNTPAMYAFKGAMAAEIEHAKMFKMALADLPGWKAEGKEFLVCSVCGFTSMDMKLKVCPVCEAPRSKFDLIK